MSNSSNNTVSNESLRRIVRAIVMHDGPVLKGNRHKPVEVCKQVMDILAINVPQFDRRVAEQLIMEEVMG